MATIIFTGEYSEASETYQVLCEFCRKEIGWLTRAECGELSCGHGPVACFDCDGITDDIHPMLCLSSGDRLLVFEPRLDKFITWRDIGKNRPDFKLSIETTVSCLSCSPYLPKSLLERTEGNGHETC
jgi:hypothetical protein